MKTKQIYYEESYKTVCEAVVLDVIGDGKQTGMVLDQTIFYPEGGGQPGDRGEIVGKNGKMVVENTRLVNGEILHLGKIAGDIKTGDKVNLKLDSNFRLKYMRIHSAGHLVHDVLMTMTENLIPLKGSHGSKAFLDYTGEFDVGKKNELEQKVNDAIQKGLSIITKDATIEELEKECKFIPPNLPKNKKLRMIKMGDFSAMPDGGVQVANTNEIGKVVINEITSQDRVVSIKYRVFADDKGQKSVSEEKKSINNSSMEKKKLIMYISKEVSDKFPELEEIMMPVYGVTVSNDKVLTDIDFSTPLKKYQGGNFYEQEMLDSWNPFVYRMTYIFAGHHLFQPNSSKRQG